MLFWLVVREFWKRYKPGVLVTAFGIIAFTILSAFGLVWEFEHWCRAQLPSGRLDSIVLFSLLIAIGMMADAQRAQRRR